jgi:hypothetical protein
LHPIKFGVWVATFQANSSLTNAPKYQRPLLEQFLNQLDDVELTNRYFQQDSAAAHAASATINYLEKFFSDRLNGVRLCPSGSPDLTPLDLFLFPQLKTRWMIFNNLNRRMLNEFTFFTPPL